MSQMLDHYTNPPGGLMPPIPQQDSLLARLDNLITLLTNRAHQVPWEAVLWGWDDIADYLQVGPRTVREKYAPQPDFPKPVRPGGGHPRYLAHEIVEWATTRPYSRRK